MDKTTPNALNKVFEAAITNKIVPGCVATVFTSDRVLYENSFGVNDSREKTPMRVDDIFAVKSMTKALTAAAALQLVEKGLLDLNAKASDYLPELSDIQVLTGFDATGCPQLKNPANDLTVNHLLTHTSGFGYPLWNENLARYVGYTNMPGIGSRKRSSLMLPLVFEPGTDWHYGIGLDWVGLIIEAITEFSLGDYFQRNVTGPLGMCDTGFALSDDQKLRVAKLHKLNSEGMFISEPNMPAAGEFQSGGGGLYSTASDYRKFLQMLLNGQTSDGVKIFEPSSVSQMLTNQIGDLRVKKMYTIDRKDSLDAEFFALRPKSWSAAFQISEDACHTGRPAGTAMWAGMFNCFFWLDKQNDVGGILLTQTLPFSDQPIVDLFYAMETAVYQNLNKAEKCVP